MKRNTTEVDRLAAKMGYRIKHKQRWPVRGSLEEWRRVLRAVFDHGRGRRRAEAGMGARVDDNHGMRPAALDSAAG